MNSIFYYFIDSPEARFDGDNRVPKRREMKIRSNVHIGKESNHLEETEVLWVRAGDYSVYLTKQARTYLKNEL